MVEKGVLGNRQIDHMAFVVREYFAWANFDKGFFDYVEQLDQGYPPHPEVAFGPTRRDKDYSLDERARRFWLTRVPKAERANYRVLGFIHYDRVVVIDEIGDRYNEPPHVLVDCMAPDHLFGDYRAVVESGYGFDLRRLFPEEAERRTLFPTTFPEISNEEFEAALK